MTQDNICLLTDSYKFSQWKQYPSGTTSLYSYFESREGAKFPATLFFGLQAIMMKHLEGKRVTQDKIDRADDFVGRHIGPNIFNRGGWEHILKAHEGRLPVRIRAVPEGSLIQSSNVMMTIENTDPEAFWLTSYLETLLVQVWYPCVVATQGYYMKDLMRKALLNSNCSMDMLDFMLQDFGFRGVTCLEQAGIGGGAHLLNFKGTDNVPGVLFLEDYYGATEMSGFSIPASEHSTMTSWGKERERKGYENMLAQFPTGTVAIVSDSYNIFEAVEKIFGEQMKDQILNREGTLVIRPDSGNPLDVVPRVLETLWKKFGGTWNGPHRLLDSSVRVIQGDGIDYAMVDRLLNNVVASGFCASNLFMGSGGGLLQKVDRDTQRSAFKASHTINEYGDMDVYKDPVTASGHSTKTSKRGRLKLISLTLGSHSTVREDTFPDHEDLLETKFENGNILTRHTLPEIRSRIPEGIPNRHSTA